MKPEIDIQRHRDALLAACAFPCDCAATGHALQCVIGGAAMAAAARVLTWALDQDTADGEGKVAAFVGGVEQRQRAQGKPPNGRLF